MLHLLAVVVLLVTLIVVGVPVYLLYHFLYDAGSKPVKR